MLRDFWQDLRYGARMLTHERGFTTAAVLTLALGIGATTAIFSVVDSVLLRPVPFTDIGRLAIVWETDRNTGTVREPASFPDFLDMRERSRQFEDLGLIAGSDVILTPDGGEPARLAALRVTHDALSLLGIRPIAGRIFIPEEDVPGGSANVLISEVLWEREFQRRSDAVGSTLRINDQPFTVVGVLPGSADFGTMQILRSAAYARAFADRDVRSRVDVWLPLQGDARTYVRATHPFFVVGRLAPTASVATAHEEMVGLMADLEAAYPENAARGAFVEPMADVVFGRVRPALWVLLASAGFVLLIACVNVANLLLVRGAARVREVALRTALGAAAHRLARQFMAENLLLVTVSAALGVALAFAGLKTLLALAPADIPRLHQAAVDGRVLLVTLVVAALTGIGFGLVPVVQARRLDLQSSLKADDNRGATASRRRRFLRSALVVSEIAMAMVLTLGAGLLIKSFWRISQVDTGFATEGVLKAEFTLPASRYPRSGQTWPNFVEVHRFNDELVRRVRSMPGIEAAAMVGEHPLDAGFTNSWQVVGREEESRSWPEISVRRVSAEYFATVDLRVLSGRPLAATDGTPAPPVGLINETASRQFFQGRNPVGQRLRFWGLERDIIGVVADEKFHGVTSDTPPAVYIPLAQSPSFNGAEAIVVRASGPPAAGMASLRSAIRDLDPQLAVFGLEPLSRTLAESVGQQRFLMVLLLSFAGLALVLAAIGIHGVLSYSVAERTQELGIRMALGAPAIRVTALVMGEGARLTALGIVIGTAAALALTRVLSNLLHEVSANDASTVALVLPILAAVATLATWLPARRAVRIDPLHAMRGQ